MWAAGETFYVGEAACVQYEVLCLLVTLTARLFRLLQSSLSCAVAEHVAHIAGCVTQRFPAIWLRWWRTNAVHRLLNACIEFPSSLSFTGIVESSLRLVWFV